MLRTQSVLLKGPLGELSPKLTQGSTPDGDVQSENLLMKSCAESAVESFQKVVAAM